MNRANIFPGLVGCVVFPVGAILSGVRHHSVAAALLTVFAVIYLRRTSRLIRRACRSRRLG